MLMANFKSAADLRITDIEQAALVTVLYMLDRGEIVIEWDRTPIQNAIDMGAYFATGRDADCGTVACLCGWAHKMSHKQAFPELLHSDQLLATRMLARRLSRETLDLFYINADRADPESVDQIAAALRSYLTTGDARWDLALA